MSIPVTSVTFTSTFLLILLIRIFSSHATKTFVNSELRQYFIYLVVCIRFAIKMKNDNMLIRSYSKTLFYYLIMEVAEHW